MRRFKITPLVFVTCLLLLIQTLCVQGRPENKISVPQTNIQAANVSKHDSKESEASSGHSSASNEEENKDGANSSSMMMGDDTMHSDGKDSMKCSERVFAIVEAEKMCVSMPFQNTTETENKGGFFKKMKDGFSRGIEIMKNATRETINKAKKKLGMDDDEDDYLSLFTTSEPSELDGMSGYRGYRHPVNAVPPRVKTETDNGASNKTCEYYRCILNSIHVIKNSVAPDEDMLKSWVAANVTDTTEKIALQERVKECFTEIKPIINKINAKIATDKSSSSSEEDVDIGKSGCEASLKLVQCLSKNAECPTFIFP